MQLITYVDRLAGDLKGLKVLLENELSGLFSGVHMLPFFNPIDGADTGFDPIDHATVDFRLGDWEDVRDLAITVDVMADLIVNHVSVKSMQFEDVMLLGSKSEHWNLFLKKTDVFNDKPTLNQLQKIYRPRPTPPFSKIKLLNGEEHDFWTTFSSDQLDINIETPAGKRYIQRILETFSRSGVKEIRLDAAGYAIKRANTRCFMLAETYAFIQEFDVQAKKLGMETLVEIHSHYEKQIEIARKVSRVYDFALSPLVLHAINRNDFSPLVKWLQMSPRNCVTVLDTHDGIGILDVASDGTKDGLLKQEEIDNLVETIHDKSNGTSRLASGEGSGNLDIYQVNCTYYDALGRDDTDYLIARAIQFFAPGEPQVYYVGLLAGSNDMALFEQSNAGRDINRHRYTPDEIHHQLQRPVVRSLLDLISVRNEATAFSGSFDLDFHTDSALQMCWNTADSSATLNVDLDSKNVQIEVREGTEVCKYFIKGGELHSQTKQDAA